MRALPLVLVLTAAAADARAATVCADDTVEGIDVSYWQGSIDWSQVAAAGIDFAFIRVTHGLGTIDTRFDANWAGARANGIIRGAYQYFEPGDDPLEQADLFLELMGELEEGDLPPVLDVEERGSLTPAQMTAAIHVWMDRVSSATGRTPIIYAGKYFWNDHVGSADFADHPLWIAQWNVECPDLPAAWGDWVFHQTSATGSIPGISGDVDTDLFNGTYDELLAFAAGEVVPCEPVPPDGRVIDDEDACFDVGGSPAAIRRVEAGHDAGLIWTYTTDWAQEDNHATWSLDFAVAGKYRVEVYTAAPWAQSKQAAYTVRHAGVEDVFVVDQSAQDGWALVAELDFAAGADQWIWVRDNTGEPLDTQTQIVFDAVRVTPVAAGPEPEPEPEDPSDPADPTDPDAPAPPAPGVFCAVTAGTRGGHTGVVVLLAIAVVVALRRRAR